MDLCLFDTQCCLEGIKDHLVDDFTGRDIQIEMCPCKKVKKPHYIVVSIIKDKVIWMLLRSWFATNYGDMVVHV